VSMTFTAHMNTATLGQYCLLLADAEHIYSYGVDDPQ
jgi:hypothetical protein